jgi:predicted site-specific integrase-resolvase
MPSGGNRETMQETTSQVALPERLVTRIEDRLPRTRFDSVEAYVVFAMEEVLVHVEDEESEARNDEVVESRLESLGYLE